jgi:hypothetical protein
MMRRNDNITLTLCNKELSTTLIRRNVKKKGKLHRNPDIAINKLEDEFIKDITVKHDNIKRNIT